MEVVVGCIQLKLISVQSLKDHKLTLYFAIKGVFVILYDMGAWTIIWHISFKYWETSRQFTRLIRMQKSYDNSNSNNHHRNGSSYESAGGFNLVDHSSREGHVLIKG